MFGRLLLEPQGGEGNGAAAETKTEAEGKAPDLNRVAESLASKHGDPLSALRVVLNEGYQYRDQIRDLKAKLPAEGSVVLAGDDAKHWSSYKQFGTPGDLKKALEAGRQSEAEATSFRKAEVTRSAAEIHGFKPSVLGTLARDLTIEISEAQGKDGKAVRVAVVKGDGDEKTPLGEYAEKHWPDFLPSLRAEKDAAPRIGTPAIPRPRTVPAGSGQAAGRRRPTSSL